MAIRIILMIMKIPLIMTAVLIEDMMMEMMEMMRMMMVVEMRMMMVVVVRR